MHYALCTAICVVCLSAVSLPLYGQSGVVENKTAADLKLDKVGDTVVISTEILDGFSYRFPFTISTESEHISFDSLTAESVCNCVQIRFAKGSLSKNSVASGEIFLRPKSGQLVEGVRITGLRDDGADPKVGEGDNTVCLLGLKVRVASPVKLSDAFLLVEDGKLQTNEVAIEIAEGVSIKSVKNSCSEPGLKVSTDSNFSKVVITQEGVVEDGRVHLDFDLLSHGVQGKISREIAFGKRVKTRVVPSILTFSRGDSMPSQKCIVISHDFYKSNLGRFECLVRDASGKEWSAAKFRAEFSVKDVGQSDKGVLRLTMEDKSVFEEVDKWTLRLVDRSLPNVFVDVDCKWLD